MGKYRFRYLVKGYVIALPPNTACSLLRSPISNTILSHPLYPYMNNPRKISQIIEPQNAIVGAGVKLRRSIAPRVTWSSWNSLRAVNKTP